MTSRLRYTKDKG